MTKNEKDYSDYISQLLNLTNGLHFFAGFIFTSITILLTQLSDRSQMQAQVTLFFLALLFYLLVFLALYARAEVTYLSKNYPTTIKTEDGIQFSDTPRSFNVGISDNIDVSSLESSLPGSGVRGCVGVVYHLSFNLYS